MPNQLSHLIASALNETCSAAGAVFGWLGVGVLAWGGARALVHLRRATFGTDAHVQARLVLGRYLALCLEFLVAKDVLDSIVEPTWDQLGKLAVIVVLRSAIQASLARELREIE